MTTRKELLLDESAKGLSPEAEVKLKEQSTLGGMFLSMMENPGWKYLKENFIDIRLDHNRVLDAFEKDLVATRAAQRELRDMLAFIDDKIKIGQKAFDQLKNS